MIILVDYEDKEIHKFKTKEEAVDYLEQCMYTENIEIYEGKKLDIITSYKIVENE